MRFLLICFLFALVLLQRMCPDQKTTCTDPRLCCCKGKANCKCVTDAKKCCGRKTGLICKDDEDCCHAKKKGEGKCCPKGTCKPDEAECATAESLPF